MLTIFKDVLRTPRQRAAYYGIKRLVAVISGVTAGAYFKPMIGDWSLVIGVLLFFISYYTIAPIVAALVCLLEELSRL